MEITRKEIYIGAGALVVLLFFLFSNVFITPPLNKALDSSSPRVKRTAVLKVIHRGAVSPEDKKLIINIASSSAIETLGFSEAEMQEIVAGINK